MQRTQPELGVNVSPIVVLLMLTSCRAGLLYMLDVLFNLHIGYVLSKQMRQRLLMDGRQVAHLYLFHGTLIVDVLAIIPVVPEARRGSKPLSRPLIRVRHLNPNTPLQRCPCSD